MTPDHTPLDERQCRRLLAARSVGRVVYTVGALPAVLPVPYRLAGDGSVLLRVTAGSELVRALCGALVAFEVSEVDETDGSGWTVTVLGRADVVEDHARPSPAEPTDLVSVRIRNELVAGRTLPAADARVE
ncbi:MULTISPECIES: pyridoxamine 5'-phosphate oxidase family protein [unclassified Kitasatospora]|uniref:pyridoxamine 5'-phosphate oxidase family protein n=1 Tax=unclassified Kitasatospora TaxID=2633591 RepID=UPI003409B060